MWRWVEAPSLEARREKLLSRGWELLPLPWGVWLDWPGGSGCLSLPPPLSSSTELMYSAVTSRVGMTLWRFTFPWWEQRESVEVTDRDRALEDVRRGPDWQLQYLRGLGVLRWDGTVSNRLLPGGSLTEGRRRRQEGWNRVWQEALWLIQ